MPNPSTPDQLAQLNAEIASCQQQIASLPPTELGPTLATLQDLVSRRDALQAQLQGVGTLVQGDDNLVATNRGVVVGRDAQIVVSGDNNTVQAILLQTHIPKRSQQAMVTEISRYLTWLRDRSAKLELRGIKREGQQVVQLDLETVYVPLAARVYDDRPTSGSGKLGSHRTISLSEILQQGPRLVITGGPGSGKTTVLMHLAWSLANAIAGGDMGVSVDPESSSQPIPLPLMVSLSAYAEYRRNLPRNTSSQEKTLAAFISRYLIERQTSFDLPADFFTQLLREGRAVLLLLDGLDEVPNEAERVQVRAAIEDLAAGRRDLRIVITCRSAAYKDRTALGGQFREVQVLPLSEAEVAALVRQAYQAIYPHDTALQAELSVGLLAQIERLEDERVRRHGPLAERLVTSPLLVRLLLIVHFSERNLPDQRAELYMKATDAMLLPGYNPDQQVADEIGQMIGGSRERHRDLVQHIAYHMHQRGESQGREISERELLDILAMEPAYAAMADDFIALTRLRGTLLEERLGMYRFLHFTFQEFMAARYLAEVVGREAGTAGMARMIEQELAHESWWREPLLLLIGYLFATSPQAAIRLLQRLSGLAPDDTASASLDTQWATAELAGTAVLEWQAGAGDLVPAIARQLARMLTNKADVIQVIPSRRASLGAVLGAIGDPRPETTKIDRIDFGLIPAGSFWMGTGKETHEVSCLNYPYWLACYPITRAHYLEFVADAGYQTEQWWGRHAIENDNAWQEGAYFGRQAPYNHGVCIGRHAPYIHGPDFQILNAPVVGVSWFEAFAFTRWLTARWQKRGWLPDGWEVALPSEAEWEKGARGGIQIPESPIIQTAKQLSADRSNTLVANPLPKRRYPWQSSSLYKTSANYAASGIGHPSSRGCFPDNVSVYGLEEMIGNVYEWTRSMDWPYPYNPDDGREALKWKKKNWMQLRGGSWWHRSKWQRCSERFKNTPFDVGNGRGFRVAVVPQAVIRSESRDRQGQ